MHLIRHPPVVEHGLSWRSLYRNGAFAQRELQPSSTLLSRARDRGIRLGIGDKTLRSLDDVGALSPIAFSHGPYFGGFVAPAEPDENLAFRDEEPGKPWSEHEYDLDGNSRVNALYSPWQLLYADEAVRGGSFDVPLWVLVGETEQRERAIGQLRGWAQAQEQAWMGLDRAWRSLVMVLVRLQNRYWPDLTMKTTLLFDPDNGERFDPYPSERNRFAPVDVLAELGGDRAALVSTYHFLVERGLDRDPQDGLTMLRRARPRPFHIRWRGPTRHAQDHFDAADLIRRFLVELDGEQPPRPELWPLDGRQPERSELYDRGPGREWSGREVLGALQEVDLYPHGVHVIHEGKHDRTVISLLVEAMLGSAALEELNFTNLKGAGGAGMVADLAASLEGYARRTVIVLDNEAKAREHVEALLKIGTLVADDVLLFETSLEEASASLEELVEFTNTIAASRGVDLALVADELQTFHDDEARRARERGREPPSLPSSLHHLVSKVTRGTWHLRKADLIDALAQKLIDEMATIVPSDSSRPLVRFVANRVVPPLNRPIPVGPE